MSTEDQKMHTLLAETEELLGVPSEDVARLVMANVTSNVLESVMRMRALTELSNHTDSETLICLAAAVTRHRNAVSELVAALTSARH
jgi:hypothetical protein